MPTDPSPLHPVNLTLAQRWLDQHVDPAPRATALRKLHGGMIHEVWYIEVLPASEGETPPLTPASVEPPPGATKNGTATPAIVAKINKIDHADLFQHEAAVLNWYRQNTGLPTPAPIAAFTDADHGISGLLMLHVPGRTLDQARISPVGVERLQNDFAQHIGALHQHTADHYGSLLSDHGYERWLDLFRPMILAEYQAVRDQLVSRSRGVIEDMIADLHRWLPEAGRPTVVHGDLWATNILVDDHRPDRPVVAGFIDGTATACDPEYELSYLRLFKTADDSFFQEYTRFHDLREGFDRRCRVYWLNTMMLHVRLFGDQYLPSCEDLVAQIARLAK